MTARISLIPGKTRGHRPRLQMYQEENCQQGNEKSQQECDDSLLPLWGELPGALDELYELVALAVPVGAYAALGNRERGIDGGCTFELRIAQDHAERCNGCGKAEIGAGVFEGLPAIDQWKHQRPAIASIGVLVADLYC